MAKTRKEKETIVENLAADLKKAKALIFVAYQGLTVAKISQLRRRLKEKGHKYNVVKKTLIKKGLEKAGLKGPEIIIANGLIIGFDEIEPIKLLVEFIKENPEMQIENGLVENQLRSKKEIIDLAKLPDRNGLLIQIIFTLESPLFRLLNVCQHNSRNLLYLLSSIKK